MYPQTRFTRSRVTPLNAADTDTHTEVKHMGSGHLLANGQQTLLYGVPLSFGEGSPLGKPVYCLQCRVDQRSVVLCSGKEGGASCEEWEHSRTYVPVQCQSSLGGA